MNNPQYVKIKDKKYKINSDFFRDMDYENCPVVGFMNR